MIIGLVVGLVLVAVPLYLWRRPEQASTEPTASAADNPSAMVLDGGAFIPLVDAGTHGDVKLSPFTTMRCTDPGPGSTAADRCDHITFFEDALGRALRENAMCAPQTSTGATISIVMDIDFRRKQLKIFRGKSSTLPDARTKELFECLKRAMPAPEWGSIPHQHSRYVVSVKAEYPPSETF